jgi:hypothetical protein
MREGMETTMADETLDPPGNAGDTNGNPDSSGSTAATPVKAYTKDEHTAAIKREVGKVLAEKAALEQRLAAIEEEKRLTEEAKLSATQRADLERKREREATEAKIAALTQQATTERTKRHEVLRQGRAASLASTLAAQLANAGLLPHVERTIAERLVVEADEHGNERVVIQMGAPGDNEPLESGFPKFRDANLTAFLKVAGGSGGQHGAGAGSGGPMPTTLVDAMLQSARRRAGR